MKTPRLLPLLVCLLWTGWLQAQSNLKTECHNMDYLVQKTVETLQKGSDSLYYNLVDTAALVSAMRESLGSDPKAGAVETYRMMRAQPELMKKLFVAPFDKLLASIATQLPAGARRIEYAGYTVRETKTEKTMTHYTLTVSVKANGSMYHFQMHETKQNECYYIFTPVDVIFNKS